MTTYQVVDAHDNADSLADVSPQPASPNGIRYADYRFSADGTVSAHGYAYIDLVWNSLTREQYNAIMASFGLSQSVHGNAVTVRVRLNDDTFANYNGYAMHIMSEKRARAFWKDLVIRVSQLETPA